ncbi:MAG: amidohydrolase family protein [Sphingomicrobium sp.]|nr:amidohydrolase family protein [Sphingomonadales bacterium]
MRVDRRSFLGGGAMALSGAELTSSALSAAPIQPLGRHYRIATEEAFTTPELANEYRRIAQSGSSKSLDLILMRTIFNDPPMGSLGEQFRRQLLNMDERLHIMDQNGVDMHLLSLTIPGVQMFERDAAIAATGTSNDYLADVVRRHPTRFAGLAAFAPQDPTRSAREMQRAIASLRLNGFIINSHTNNEYLDNEKYWEIFEAAEALDRPIYLHPRSPSDGMAEPFRDYQLGGSMWGYAIEAGTHAVRLIMSGVFDRFPKLKIVLGHMGEDVPYWLWRLDYMHARRTSQGQVKKLALKPSEYFLRNFAVTTSGVESHDVLNYVLRVLGADNVMWAIDYPYQPTAPAVAFMDTAPIADAVKAKVYHSNAARIFRLASAGATGLSALGAHLL